MSESQFNYTVIEKMHKSPIWDNHILKVRVRGKDKIYVLKLYGGINEPFQKLVFNREMEALKVLNSCSNIVKIRDTTASLKYNGKSNYGAILMDYVDGKTLDLYDWHSFTQLKKYEICLKILQAVYNAHANDVIHRDLKPQNIIYDDVNDEITIIDFGSSKIKTIIEKETTMPMFSENYSAPEVVKGNDITEKCDYYSLGVIFSELFLCKEAESNVETIWAFDSQFTAALTENMGKSNLSIYYAQSNNIKAAKKQIEWNFKGGCKCVEKDKKCFFCWKTESYLLYGVPKLRNVIDDNTTCLCMSYYLRINA